MKNKSFLTALAFTLAGFTALPAMAEKAAFYVISNKAKENTIVGYKADDNGKFSMFGEYNTGGLGTGDLEIPALKKDDSHPLANGDDPLISANSLASTADGKYFVAVNPGNATLSLMKVEANGSLKAADTVLTSDKFPISVAIHGNMVVAASVGLDNGNGSIAAYEIKDGRLSAVAGSRRDLKARPSTIAFSSDGEHVIVNELVTGKIKVFSAVGNSLSAEPVSVIDSPRGSDERFQAIPVGFKVRGDGGDDVLLVSEARFLTPDFKLREGNGSVVLSPKYSWQTGSTSSYNLSDNGSSLSIKSPDVLTGSAIEGGQIANCWVALSHDGNTLYAANALSSSITSYAVGQDGSLSVKNVTAFKEPSEKLFFSDIEVSRDGKQLYQLVGNTGEVMIFDIADNGDLKHNQTVGGLPKLGTYGLLVK